MAAKRLAIFVSAEQTGTGASQSIAHRLGVKPFKVFVACTCTAAGAFKVTEGTHTDTNVVLTVTSGAKYKVTAFAWR